MFVGLVDIAALDELVYFFLSVAIPVRKSSSLFSLVQFVSVLRPLFRRFLPILACSFLCSPRAVVSDPLFIASFVHLVRTVHSVIYASSCRTHLAS